MNQLNKVSAERDTIINSVNICPASLGALQ